MNQHTPHPLIHSEALAEVWISNDAQHNHRHPQRWPTTTTHITTPAGTRHSSTSRIETRNESAHAAPSDSFRGVSRGVDQQRCSAQPPTSAALANHHYSHHHSSRHSSLIHISHRD